MISLRRTSIAGALVLSALLPAAASAQSAQPTKPIVLATPGPADAASNALHDGPWLGTWRRRDTNPNANPANAMVLKMWKEGNGIHYTITPSSMEAWVRFDGKPYPEKGNASADHNIFERIDDHTITLRDIKDGKETIRFRITYSADGKLRTSTSSRTNEKGETTSSTSVWDRIE